VLQYSNCNMNNTNPALLRSFCLIESKGAVTPGASGETSRKGLILWAN